MITYTKRVIVDMPPQALGTAHGKLVQSHVADEIRAGLPIGDKLVRFEVTALQPTRAVCVGYATIEVGDAPCQPMLAT